MYKAIRLLAGCLEVPGHGLGLKHLENLHTWMILQGVQLGIWKALKGCCPAAHLDLDSLKVSCPALLVYLHLADRSVSHGFLLGRGASGAVQSSRTGSNAIWSQQLALLCKAFTVLPVKPRAYMKRLRCLLARHILHNRRDQGMC